MMNGFCMLPPTMNAQPPKRAAAAAVAAAVALNDEEGDAHDLHDGFA